MHKGNWPCSSCDATITELPFEPRSNAGLTCRDCYFQKKDGGGPGASNGSGAGAPADTGAAADVDDRDVPPFDPNGGGLATEPAPESPDMQVAPVTEKKMFAGNWQCGTCDGPITELPFEPRSTNNLKCRDCFIKERSG